MASFINSFAIHLCLRQHNGHGFLWWADIVVCSSGDCQVLGVVFRCARDPRATGSGPHLDQDYPCFCACAFGEGFSQVVSVSGAGWTKAPRRCLHARKTLLWCDPSRAFTPSPSHVFSALTQSGTITLSTTDWRILLELRTSLLSRCV